MILLSWLVLLHGLAWSTLVQNFLLLLHLDSSSRLLSFFCYCKEFLLLFTFSFRIPSSCSFSTTAELFFILLPTSVIVIFLCCTVEHSAGCLFLFLLFFCPLFKKSQLAVLFFSLSSLSLFCCCSSCWVSVRMVELVLSL